MHIGVAIVNDLHPLGKMLPIIFGVRMNCLSLVSLPDKWIHIIICEWSWWINITFYFITEWNNWVSFGVMNCAQADSCNDFNVRGTPTIRIFYPRTNLGEFGLDIKSNNNIAYWKNIVFDHVEISQSKGLFPKEVGIPNLMPLRWVL